MKTRTEKIWNEFSKQLRLFILRRIPDQNHADDILQDVFLKIHSRINTLQDDTKIRGWIYRVTRNTIIDYYRIRKIDVEIPESFPAFIDNTPYNNISQELLIDIKEMIQALPEPYREILLMTENEEITQKELAHRLGISLSGAKSRVQRGRKKLKDMLLECCHFEFDRYQTVIDYYPRCCPCCSTGTSEKK